METKEKKRASAHLLTSDNHTVSQRATSRPSGNKNILVSRHPCLHKLHTWNAKFNITTRPRSSEQKKHRTHRDACAKRGKITTHRQADRNASAQTQSIPTHMYISLHRDRTKPVVDSRKYTIPHLQNGSPILRGSLGHRHANLQGENKQTKAG